MGKALAWLFQLLRVRLARLLRYQLHRVRLARLLDLSFLVMLIIVAVVDTSPMVMALAGKLPSFP